MNDIKKYLNKDFVFTLSFFFTLIFLIINLGVFLLNVNYKNNIAVQKNEAFRNIVEHMIIYTDEETVKDYIEHYSHIHNTSTKYYSNDQLLFETDLDGKNYEEYELIINEELVGKLLIDDTYSPNTLLNSTFLLVMNIFIVIFYLISILLFYSYTKRKVSLMIDDVNKITTKLHSIKNSNYNFSVFNEISEKLVELNKKYNELKVNKTNELRTITHDMKTPLTILLSYIEGIISNRIEPSEDTLLMLKEEILTLNSLIESINRSESTVKYEVINFSDLLVDQVNRFMHVFKTKGISVDLDVDKDVLLLGEKDALSRIIYNLISNSFYYTKANGNVIVTLKSDVEVLLTIKDNGVGIESKYINNIFNKNFRVKDTTKLHKRGSGLGLYIVKLLVEEIDGRIEVNSTIDVGTEFKIYFKKI